MALADARVGVKTSEKEKATFSDHHVTSLYRVDGDFGQNIP
jgi:hypothetical protein